MNVQVRCMNCRAEMGGCSLMRCSSCHQWVQNCSICEMVVRGTLSYLLIAPLLDYEYDFVNQSMCGIQEAI